MALGSKNRDYKTEDRAVRAAIKKHIEIMQRFMSLGLTRIEASKRALEEMNKFGRRPRK